MTDFDKCAGGGHVTSNDLLGGSAATFSPCRRYRYTLWRRWGDGPYAMFVGLNPSTADETQDDPTIRRCIRFARDWGYSALCMTNLFALRATDPKVMLSDPNPEGQDNDYWLVQSAAGAGIVVAAWGAHGGHQRQDDHVRRLLPGKLHHLALTKDGKPRHPLYLRADSTPVLMPPNAY